MTNLVYDALLSVYRGPRNSRTGEHSLNCPACIHQGTSADTRKRGSFALKPNDLVLYNCFNCKFATGYQPGDLMPAKMKRLLAWMGMSHEAIQKLSLKVWAIREVGRGSTTIPLPRDARPMQEWLDDNCTDMRFLRVAQAVVDSNPAELSRLWWTPEPGEYQLDNCVIDTQVPQGNRMGWEAFNVIDGSDPIGPQGPVQTPEIDFTDPKWAAEITELERLHKLHEKDAQDEQ